MALQGAIVTTLKLLLTGPFTIRLWLPALYRRVYLGDIAWAEQRLVRNPPTRLAEAQVTEIRALMASTGELLVAGLDAQVLPSGVIATTLTLHWTTNFGALMFITRLELVANSITPEVVGLRDLLWAGKKSPLLRRVVDQVAWEANLSFTTDARFLDHLFALHAVPIVTGFNTLMLAAR